VEARFELIANPKDTMKRHLAFGRETSEAAVAGQQWPTSSFGDRESERISR